MLQADRRRPCLTRGGGGGAALAPITFLKIEKATKGRGDQVSSLNGRHRAHVAAFHPTNGVCQAARLPPWQPSSPLPAVGVLEWEVLPICFALTTGLRWNLFACPHNAKALQNGQERGLPPFELAYNHPPCPRKRVFSWLASFSRKEEKKKRLSWLRLALLFSLLLFLSGV